MNLNVMFFARYREALGLDVLSVSGEFATVQHLRESLMARGGEWGVLAEPQLMCARNEALCKLDEPLQDGDEVAFFPTVTGG